jgi:glycosyltransferase involved in cell wall biosynthesis
MRILHVISSLAPRYGGPSKAVIEMCGELVRRGERAAIYTTDADIDGRLDVPLKRPVEVDGIPITYFPVDMLRLYKISRSLAGALRSSLADFDVVHIHSLYQFPATAAAVYCRRYGIPYIVRPHGTLDPFLYRRHRIRKRIYETIWERRNLSAAAAVHFTTEEEMTLASSLGLHFRGVVIPLGTSFESRQTSSGKLAELWPETAKKKVVLFMGRINFKKGLDILIRAFGEVARDRSDVHLLIAGPDNEGYGSRVRRWVKEHHVGGKTTFTGMLLGTAKAAALTDSSMFILPSYTENFGIAVVEAMAAGLPVIISDRVNIWREILRAGAGLVVAADARATAEAIKQLLNSPLTAIKMGERAATFAHNNFSWPAAGAKLVELYQEVALLRPTYS